MENFKKDDKNNYFRTSILLDQYQKKWIKENEINISKLTRFLLDKYIKEIKEKKSD
jgi:hypothetical protein